MEASISAYALNLRYRRSCVTANLKSGSALPSGTFSAWPAEFRSRIGIPQFSTLTPQGVGSPRLLWSDVSHRLFVMPMPGLFPLPTQTRKPSSLRWNELPEPPQSLENGAGSFEQLVMKRWP